MPGSHKKGPIVSREGFSVGDKYSNTQVIASDAFVNSSRIREDVIRTVSIPITNAEIKLLNSAPKELVAAPGANKMIQLLGAVLYMDYGSNVLEGSRALVIGLDDGTKHVTADIAHGDFHENTADSTYVVQPALGTDEPAADVFNKNLALLAKVGEISGNSGDDTTFTVKVAYRVLDFS